MNILASPLRVILFVVLLLTLLYFGKPVLVPVCFGALLAMLFAPLCRWMESKGRARWFGPLLSVIILAVFVAGVVLLLTWQFSDLSKDLQGIEKKASEFGARL